MRLQKYHWWSLIFLSALQSDVRSIDTDTHIYRLHCAHGVIAWIAFEANALWNLNLIMR